jgi:hypothetical protein
MGIFRARKKGIMKRFLMALSVLALVSTTACGSKCDDMLDATKKCFAKLGLPSSSLSCDGDSTCDKQLECAKNAANNSCTTAQAYQTALQACIAGGC